MEQVTSKVLTGPYNVIFIDKDGKKGHQIVMDTNRADCPQEVIFGMDAEPSSNLYWLEYITMRLNRAFLNGWYGAQGISSWPDKEYYEDLDKIWQKLTGKPLEKNE